MSANTPKTSAARQRPRLLLVLLCGCLGAALSPAAASAGVPLNPSDYEVGALCGNPSPGYAGCFGLRLMAKDPLSMPAVRLLSRSNRNDRADSGSAAEGSGTAQPQTIETTEPVKGSRTPANLLSAYGLSGISPPSPQTIALVDAFDDVNAEADLAVFDERFGLPACTTANGCFRKVNQSGDVAPLPVSSGKLERGWAQEIATDVEVAHGVCQSCRILLVEAKSNSNNNLYTAERTAVALGATVISNSWGGEETSGDSVAFDHPGVVITASSGDNGYLDWFSNAPATAANYPASSPHVVAVGGTRLTSKSETVWNDGGFIKSKPEGAGAGGGGCSTHFAAPIWQQNLPDWSAVACGARRAVADVSADGDPFTGVAVYDSTETPEEEKGWATIGGTSVASPIVAATFGLAGGANGVAYPARTLYENESLNPASLHDVTLGSNGECHKPFEWETASTGCTVAEEADASCTSHAICLAGAGYDGPSGVGTPNGIAAFTPNPGAGSGGETGPATSPGPAPSASTGTSAPGAPGVLAPPVRLPVVSALSLTRRAIVALNRHRPKLSKVGFAFTLNLPARVRVSIARRVRVHGRTQWKAISSPLMISAASGAQTRSLIGHSTLAAGRYRLTLTPSSGAPRSIVFQIG